MAAILRTFLCYCNGGWSQNIFLDLMKKNRQDLDVTRMNIGVFMVLAEKRPFDDTKFDEYTNSRLNAYASPGIFDLNRNDNILTNPKLVAKTLIFDYSAETVPEMSKGVIGNNREYYSDFMFSLLKASEHLEFDAATRMILDDMFPLHYEFHFVSQRTNSFRHAGFDTESLKNVMNVLI